MTVGFYSQVTTKADYTNHLFKIRDSIVQVFPDLPSEDKTNEI